MAQALHQSSEELIVPSAGDSSLGCRNRSVYHVPVMLQECMDALNIKSNGIYLDGTMGGGGHISEIISRLDTQGIAIGIDRDADAIACCAELSINARPQVFIRQSRFSDFDLVLNELNITGVDGILLDLGVSSHQLFANERGFSYMRDVRLDMRMNASDSESAADLLRNSTEEYLGEILRDNGEIQNPHRMAATIKKYLQHNVLETAKDLRKCLEQEYGSHIQIKVLAKLFQALRIAVNGELDELKNCCEKTLRYLNVGGRFAVLSYHSLEDRIVKNFMRDNEKGCTCPPGLPMCICNRKPILKRVSTRAIKSTEEEISHNVASRSARLRVAERIAL